ncbi:trans-aconitate 2-methyltransferase [Roseomonas hellenica]|uniref:Trans-aconitate 2-methyltransferase n=1 Tax=Plastoroseomonas hellenica TaxID=2687306 RepID=A0ABS5F200_9PROT|nr:trans-aconitate 2-methyltransferase [Plastoroseomonas hellenica]MBR0666150.1 trans-aconitate 2-methyltransferase [Plastoroseomonas hellenica]
MSWSATQYSKFERERNRPVQDLLAQVVHGAVTKAADIGCGPGNSTELLRARFPGAVITGMDSSEDMIAAARKRLPDIQFELADIGTWQGASGPFDVILANAVLQWVPDHAALLPALLAKLAPGGSLAVQQPDNLDEPAHRLMRQVAEAGPWAAKLAGASREARHGPDWYYRILTGVGATVDVWRTIFHHPLPGGPGAVVEWFKGSALRPYLNRLDESERGDFLARYEALIAEAYPALPDGTVLLPFPRLFFVATRPADGPG